MGYSLIDELKRDGKLLHYLDFRPHKATLADLSGNGYDPTVVGGVQWAGGGLKFNGTTGYLDLDAHIAAISSLTQGTLISSIQSPEQLSMAAWTIMSASDGGDASSLVLTAVDWLAGNYLYVVDEAGAGIISDSSTASVDTSQKLFLAITQQASGYAGYIYGLAAAGLSGVTDAFFDDVNNIDNWRIGCRRSSGSNQDFFPGIIFYHLVLNVALTATEIAEIRGELDSL
jgi:hypothetical protein